MSKRTIFFVLAPPCGGGERLRDALDATIDRGAFGEKVLQNFVEGLAERLEIDPLAPAPIDETALNSANLRADRLEARKIVLEAPKDAFPLVFFHPTSVALLPFWQSVFEDTDIRARMIMLVGNPLHASDRMKETTKFDESLRLTLWTQSIVHALAHGEEDTQLIHYPGLLTEPKKILSTILEQHSNKWPDRVEEKIGKIDRKFIEPGMGDLAYTTKDLLDHASAPGFIKNLYTRLSSACADGPVFFDDIDRDTLLNGHEEISFLLGAMDHLNRKNNQLEHKLSSIEDTLNTLTQSNDKLQANIELYEQTKQKLVTENASLSARVSDINRDLETARHSNNEQIGILSEKNEALTRTVEDTENTLADLQKLLEQNRITHEDRTRSLITENRQLSEKVRASDLVTKEIRRERVQDQQRFNIERASLLKQQKQRDQEFKELLANLKTDIGSTHPKEAKGIPSDAISEETSNTPAHSPKQDEEIRRLNEHIAQAEQKARDLEAEKRRSEELTRAAERKLLDQDASIAEIQLDAQSAREEIRALKNSTSWKISAPVRGVKTAARSPRTTIRSIFNRPATPTRAELTPVPPSAPSTNSLNRPLPKKRTGKTMLKTGLFTTLPFLFSGTGAYKNWKAARTRSGSQNTADPLFDKQSPQGKSPLVSNNGSQNTAISIPYTNDLSGYVALSSTKAVTNTKSRAIAFYLPQYHEIAENNEWWGEGFTEWANVRPAKPQFQDHYQPHIPGDLGYYDLVKDETILHRQVEMARNHGLSGFAFYFYWFGGKRLLETPLQRYRDDRSIDFPYLLCFANENWNRRWDGAENEVLIEQKHSPEDDLAFIEHVSSYLRDPRYIRIDGKPVLLVYRPGLLPSARETSERWRDWCHKNGIGDIYLAYTQGFEKLPPGMFGYDAAIEFPPNNHGLLGNPNLVPPKADGFKGKVFDWRDLVKRSHHYPPANYKLFRGVNPSWDNTARRKSNGTVLLNSNPALYCEWLANAVADTQMRFTNPDERLIFINAWNEWAEGAHLEPDEKYGYAWLEATRRALTDQGSTDLHTPQNPTIANSGNQSLEDGGALDDGVDDSEVLMPLAPGKRALANKPVAKETLRNTSSVDPTEKTTSTHNISGAKKKIIVVTHDLFRHGAQFLALNMVRTLTERFGYQVHIIACKDGPLRTQFEQYGPLSILEETSDDQQTLEAMTELAMQGFRHAIVNSSASGWVSRFLSKTGIDFVGLVHEMPSIIESMGLEANLHAMDTHAKSMVFPATIVRDKAARFLPKKNWRNPVLAPQGLYKQEAAHTDDEVTAARSVIEVRHKIPPAATLFLGVGFADHRKGIDLFLHWAVDTIKEKPDAHFIWLGDIAHDMRDQTDAILKSAGNLAEQIHLPGFVSQTRDYYLAADMYVLSSREDPFPSTALEALSTRTPVVMIARTGGIEDLVPDGCVRTLNDDTSTAFRDTIKEWVEAPETRRQAGLEGSSIVAARFGFVSFIGKLLDELDATAPGVSVVVPGFNYEAYIEKRMRSIIDQSEPPREIIYLDDASTDNSIAIVRRCLANCAINYRIIENEKNSGNVFSQWQKGANLATEPIIWIAEADDWADEHFIETLAPRFENDAMMIAYCESRQIDGAGKVIAPDYRYYVNDVSPTRWRQDFQGSGPGVVGEALSTKNTIPNVSAALIRSVPLVRFLNKELDTLRKFRTVGDWYVYVNLLQKGDLWFDTAPLNYHRRHDESVTISKFDLQDLSEIADMQARIADRFLLTFDQKDKAKRYIDHLIEHFDMRDQYSDTQLTNAITLTPSGAPA